MRKTKNGRKGMGKVLREGKKNSEGRIVQRDTEDILR